MSNNYRLSILKDKIEFLRKEIDFIDKKILRLINKRLNLAMEIGRLKKESGFEIIDDIRENAVFNRLNALNNGELKLKSLKIIFNEIIYASRFIQGDKKY